MPEKSKVGVGLFILSEANFFGALIVGYIYFHLLPSPGPNPATSLDPQRMLIFSAFLFLSSATAHLASLNFKARNLSRVRLWLAITLVLGAVFIAGEGLEYRGLLENGVTLSTNLFGTTFFTLTGFHGLHVLVGLFALAILFGLALNGRLESRHTAGFEAVAMYWHFVDAAWVFIFSTVYIWSTIK
jgi:heme/copper-type cytochrome/quinol oxidase subunit 3